MVKVNSPSTQNERKILKTFLEVKIFVKVVDKTRREGNIVSEEREGRKNIKSDETGVCCKW